MHLNKSITLHDVDAEGKDKEYISYLLSVKDLLSSGNAVLCLYCVAEDKAKYSRAILVVRHPKECMLADIYNRIAGPGGAKQIKDVKSKSLRRKWGE